MKSEQLSPYLEVKQHTDRDSRQLGPLVSDRYEATSTASQTIITLPFVVVQDAIQKNAFQLYVDGNLLREGAGNDFTFTSVVSNASAEVTLTASIVSGLNIIALKIGAYQEQFPNPSSVTASLNATNLSLDQKGNKNSLINGSFDYWQRGQTFAAIANATYYADRWKHYKSSSTVATITRDTDVPTSAFGIYSSTFTVTTASGAVAAGNYVTLNQLIEGNVYRSLKGKNIVLRFWVKSPKTGVHCVSFSNNGNTRSLIKEYTVSAINTWEQKTIRFSADTTGTWLYDTGMGLHVTFALSVGTTFHGTADTWQSADKVSGSSQVNVCDTIGNVFKLSDVVMVEDNVALTSIPNFILSTDNLADELKMCQRYYEKSYDIDAAPGSVSTNGGIMTLVYQSVTATTNYMAISTQFKVTKRSVPVVVAYAPGSASPNTASTSTTVTCGYSYTGVNGVVFAPTITAGSNSNTATIQLSYTADSEI